MAEPKTNRNPLLNLSFVRMAPFDTDWKFLGLNVTEDLLALETVICTNPLAGDVVPGTGGLRKLRFSPPAWRVGKSGALRICYAFFPAYSVVALIAVYAKTSQENLTSADKKAIAKLLTTIEGQVAAWNRGGQPKGVTK